MEQNNHLDPKDTIWIEFRKQYDIDLSMEQIETIDYSYKKLKLSVIKDLGLYRLINLFISVIVFLLFVIAKSFSIQYHFFAIVFLLFLITNLYAIIDYKIKYTKLKNKTNEGTKEGRS